MKLMTGMIILFAAALGNHCSGDDKQRGDSMVRHDLHRMKLTDDSSLEITISVRSDQQRERLPVDVHLFPKGVQNEKGPDLWVARHATTVEYEPGNDRYYALAKETKDRIFIFFTWNTQHYTIEKQTGQVLQKDQGDDALKAYESLVPLKLTICPPSTTGRVAEPTDDTDLFGPS